MKKHLHRAVCCGLVVALTWLGTTPSFADTASSGEIIEMDDIQPIAPEEGTTVPVDEMTEPQPETLGVPVIQSVSTTKEGLAINWEEVPGAQGYVVCRSTEKKSGYKRIFTVKEQITGWVDTTVEPGTKYYYKLRAYRKIDGKTETSARSKACSKWTASPAPENVTAVQESATGVGVSWDASKAATQYRVYRAPAGSKTYTKIATKLTECFYTDTDVVAGETYSYKIVAVHGSLVSGKSKEATIQISNIATNTRTLLLGPGVTAQLSATSDLEGKPVWESQDEAIARVSADGLVEGVAPGVTHIYVTIGGAIASVKVTVTDCAVNGIDVSRWQQTINWNKVKESGVKFAMLRLAYSQLTDSEFENYYLGATNAGIPVGVYCYTKAKTVEDGVAEAQNLIEVLDGRPLTYPIALDLEDGKILQNMSQAKRAELITTFKEIVEDAGYQFVLYANLNWLNYYVDQQMLEDNDVDIWIARYRDQSLGHGYTGNGNVRLWQYTDKGEIDGILDPSGKYIKVDLDVNYEEYF
ncbi:MAG: GH25 family lysozyme [bacterium]|nr:GH25 family lysozyme [bacterium]